MRTKNILLLLATLLLTATLASCSDTKEEEKTDIELARELYAALAPTHLVVNQGNQASGIAGSVTALNYASGQSMHYAFGCINGFALGDTPQNVFRQGSRQYFCVFGSNLVWAVDAQTMQVVGQMKVSAPQRVAADDKWVYVASNEGYVTRFNAQTLAEDKHIEVGPNPMGLALANGDLYVSISDSYNWDGAMQNGKKVVRIDIESWQPEATILVGLNPTRLETTADGYIACVCNGFFDSEQHVYAISPDNSVRMLTYGSDCVAAGSDVYVAYSVTNWETMKTTCKLSLWNLAGGELLKDNITAQPLDYSPTFLAYDAARKLIIMGKRASGTDYTAAGSVEFRTTDGKLQKVILTGVEPYSITAL